MSRKREEKNSVSRFSHILTWGYIRITMHFCTATQESDFYERSNKMGATQPIRNRKELQKFSTYYQTVKPHPRNYALIILGLNTALRISDLLQLQWFDVYDFYTQRFREHLLILEQKTGKQNYIALNKNAKNALRWYMDACFPQESDYLFCKNTDRQHPINRSQAYRIVKEAAAQTTNSRMVSCHSMRKTFGYHAWKQGAQPALLMGLFNHSSYDVTKRYLGIEQDEKDSVYLKIDL